MIKLNFSLCAQCVCLSAFNNQTKESYAEKRDEDGTSSDSSMARGNYSSLDRNSTGTKSTLLPKMEEGGEEPGPVSLSWAVHNSGDENASLRQYIGTRDPRGSFNIQ